MAKYIDADTALKRIKQLQKTDAATVGKKQFAEGFFCGLDEAEVVLMQAPTADVAEVKHGEWIYDSVETIVDCTLHRWRCSLCGRTVMKAFKDHIKNEPYCRCGAKMDGKDNNVPTNGRS